MGRVMGKRGQEEILGFVMIVVIVSIILLFILVFFISSGRENTESPKATSFMQAAFAYTSSCADNGELLAIDKLIASCYNEERCGDESYSCDVLNETLTSLISESWPIGEERPEKGYKMEAVSADGFNFSISAGNVTNRFKGTQSIPPMAGAQVRITFTVYS